MREDTVLDGIPLIGAWALWHMTTRKPGDPFRPPPMPPLEEWPQEARETFERLRREKLLRKQRP